MISVISLVVVAKADMWSADSNIIVSVDSDKNIGGRFIDDKIYVPIRELSGLLNLPIRWDEENREAVIAKNFEKVKISEKTAFNEDGVIPNEDVAYDVGKIILEQYAGKPMEYETDDRIYFLRVIFLKKENVWRIYQSYKLKNGTVRAGGGYGLYLPTVYLNKYTGKVEYINTYSNVYSSED